MSNPTDTIRKLEELITIERNASEEYDAFMQNSDYEIQALLDEINDLLGENGFNLPNDGDDYDF